MIACVMPTSRGREGFARQAAHYFARSDWEGEMELVVVGLVDYREIANIGLPPNRWISFVPIDGTVSDKRNAALESTTAQYVFHWDDDDWHSRFRVTRQMLALRNKIDICGFCDVPFFCMKNGKTYMPTPDENERLFKHNGLCGATLAYNRSILKPGIEYRQQGNTGSRMNEDIRLMKAAVRKGATLEVVPAAEDYVVVRHGRNSWNPRGMFERNRWTEIPTVPAMRHDLAFYRPDQEALL